ncbi:MAG: hypothetical protein Q8L88_10545 [Bacteroidota bacterium]|nr:hypothetical protein [Bacteroidota bacterium]
MKMLSFLLFIIVALLVISCEQSTESTGKDVYVDFDVESAFQNDLVKLQHDGKTLFESKVTTDYTISLAWSSGLQKFSGGKHVLLFSVVDYNTKKEFNIDLTNDTSTVLIRFNKESKLITIEQHNGRMLRD